MSLSQEIENQVSEQIPQEQPEAEAQAQTQPKVLPISGVINSVFLFLSKDWDEEDRQKLILDDMESENLNEMLTPLILKLAEKLGLAIEEISALIALTGLLLPRIFLYLNIRKKYEKKKGGEKKDEQHQGEKEVNS